MVAVGRESPRQDDVVALLRQSDAHAQALYPPESDHLVDVDALAKPNVRFFVGRCERVEVIRPETGTASRDALRLYRSFGYRERGPLGAYRPDPLGVFMQKLAPA
jgi:putative acetyltransferase